MATIPEQLSNILANSQGKPDSNLAQDSNNLGGLPADDFATKEYVKKYHDEKEAKQKEHIDNQDTEMLKQAKEFANSLVRNQDFSSFAKLTDVQALDTKLSGELTSGLSNQKTYTDTEIEKVVNDTNTNFGNVNGAINTLNGNMNNLFQSVSDGKSKIAGAITDKGVSTSATDTFDNMASNIRSIPTTGGEIPEGYIDTSSATASDSDLLLGKTAFARGNKMIGSHVCTGIDTSDATATPYDILTGKTAYNGTGKIEGILSIDESTGMPSYSVGDVEKVYGVSNIIQNTNIAYPFNKLGLENKLKIICNENGEIVGIIKIEKHYNTDNIVDDLTLSISTYDGIYFCEQQQYSINELVGKNILEGADDTDFSEALNISIYNNRQGYVSVLARNYLIVCRFFKYEDIISTNPDGSQNIKYYLKVDNDRVYIKDFKYYYKSENRIIRFTNDIEKEVNEACRFLVTGVSDLYSTAKNFILCVAKVSVDYGSDLTSDEDNIYTPYIKISESIEENGSLVYFKFVNNGTLLMCAESDTRNNTAYGKIIFFFINEKFEVSKRVLSTIIQNGKDELPFITPDGKYVIEGTFKEIYKLEINYTEETIVATKTNISLDGFKTSNNTMAYEFSNDGKYLYGFVENYIAYGDYRLDMLIYEVIYDVDTFSIKLLKKLTSENSISRTSVGGRNFQIFPYQNVLYMYDGTQFKMFYMERDYSEVVALLYNGDYYYKTFSKSLTASPTDVLKDKTFIGSNGKPEKGTLTIGGATNE